MVKTAPERPAFGSEPLHRAGLLARLETALARPMGEATSDFDLNPAVRPQPASLRPAGVLVAITPDERVVLTKRSSRLKHHPGQIALPGGKVDPGDGGPIGAALREAEEEVGLPRQRAQVLGVLPAHVTVTSFAVTPVLALVPDFQPRPEAGEVEEVFHVPLSHLLDESRYSIQQRIYNGSVRAYYTVPYGPYYIWGATARILRELAARLA